MSTLFIKEVEFKIDDDGVFLRVDPQQQQAAGLGLVKDELYKRGVKNADFALIEQVITKRSSEFTWIGDKFEKYEPVKDKYIDVRISDDGLHALLSVRFPNDGIIEISTHDIRYKLWQAQVRAPVDQEKIRTIVKNKTTVNREIISSGKPALHGKDAEVIHKIDVSSNGTPLLKDDGSVDYHRLNMVKCVEKDQHLAELIPAETGTPGVNVRGQAIPPRPGRAGKLPRGLNTYISTDERNLYAKSRGHIYTKAGLLHIEPIYVVEKDVDFSTGNIEFNGEVIIKGDVKSGFKVETDGNILIRGSVDAAELISVGGDIKINGGIFGKYKAKIKAKNKVIAEFAQHAKIDSGSDLEITKYLLDCQVETKGSVNVAKGQIIGGELMTAQSIVAREIGSPKNIATKVAVGTSVDADAWMAALQIDKKIKDLKKEFAFLLERITFLELLEKRLKRLNDQKQAELSDYQKKRNEIKAAMDDLESQKKALTGPGDDFFDELPYIQANFKMYPGVSIEMGNYNEEIKDRLNAVKFIMKPDGVEKKTLV